MKAKDSVAHCRAVSITLLFHRLSNQSKKSVTSKHNSKPNLDRQDNVGLPFRAVCYDVKLNFGAGLDKSDIGTTLLTSSVVQEKTYSADFRFLILYINFTKENLIKPAARCLRLPPLDKTKKNVLQNFCIINYATHFSQKKESASNIKRNWHYRILISKYLRNDFILFKMSTLYRDFYGTSIHK